MFLPLFKLISKIIPQHSRHWNGYKVIAVFSAIMIVLALMPVPQNLRGIFAAPQQELAVGDIVVYSDQDNPLAYSGSLLLGQQYGGNGSNCAVLEDTGDVDDAENDVNEHADCTLRDAIALSQYASGNNRIVFDLGDEPVEIELQASLQIDIGDGELTIDGPIVDNQPLVIIRPDPDTVSFDGVTAQCSTDVENQHALLNIMASDVTISGLIFVGSAGDAIQITNPVGGADISNIQIEDNWIGTTTRDIEVINANEDDINGSSRNQGHGVCVSAQSTDPDTAVGTLIQDIYLTGNIIVNNNGDGIRFEGTSLGVDNYNTAGLRIVANLIGNVNGDDTNVAMGNGFSGITIRNSASDKNPSLIVYNLITNNGFANGDLDSPVGNGITLLQTAFLNIQQNYIGATLTFPGLADFPFAAEEGDFDLSSIDNKYDYIAASNACDGIAIRYSDYFPEVDDAYCPDSSDQSTTFDASAIGPSALNTIYQNQIGTNNRNGIYIQSLACTPTEDQERSNVQPLLGQNIMTTILQNSIFRNDNSTAISGTGAYGIGIDLEDEGTANLDNLGDFIADDGVSQWSPVYDGDPDFANCADELPSWASQQPNRTLTDTNITENDNYTNTSEDVGYDPDAGANRLINAPVISATGSTTEAITGTAEEGTIVELFQVSCNESDGVDAIVPATAALIRSNCDVDFINESTAGSPEHIFGHGQGARFLGNTYVPYSNDEDHVGTWTIRPGDFVLEGSIDSVKPFTGGVVTATTTGFTHGADCWDMGDTEDLSCPNNGDGIVFGAGENINAQAIGSVSVSAGFWLPGNLPYMSYENPAENITEDQFCLPFNDEDEVSYVPGVANYVQTNNFSNMFYLSCFGSTSEFSANAYIAEPLYTLSKHTVDPDLQGDASNEVAAGDTVTYSISLTNTGSSVLDLPVGSLSDVLDDSLTYTGCEWEITDINGDPLTDGDTCTGTSGNVLNTTDFGELEIGATLDILIHATVRTGLTGAACSINNTIVAEDIFDMLGAPASETGATLADNVAEEVVVTPCAAPSLTVQKTVSVAGAAETTVDISAVSSSPIAGVGGAITYYIDVANGGDSALTNLSVVDVLPEEIGNAGWTCASTTASGSLLSTHTSVSYTVGNCSVSTGSNVITTATSVGPNSVLRLRLTGNVVPTLSNATPICNNVVVSGSNGITANDSACFRVGVPVLTLTKAASDTTPDAGSTVTYTISVTNTGGFPANNVQVSDDLDNTSVGNTVIPQCVATIAGIAVQDSGSINSSTNTLSWTISSIPAGETRAVHFTAAVRPDIATSTSCPNIARATSDNAPSVTGTVTIAVGIPVDGAVLSISKQAVNESDIYELGDAVHYRVTVENSGTTTSSNLSVRDSIPSAEEDIRNATTTSGTMSTAGDEVNVSGMSVAADGSAVVNYTVSIAEDDDFPLRSYRLDQDADADDEQFYPERVRDDDVADSAHDDAEDALGARDEAFVSLGSGGEIVLDIASRRSGLTKLLVDGDGDDFCIAEQDLAGDTDRDTERYTVSVSQTTRSRDFERVGRSNGGSDCFDIGDADLTWARYIQIEDTSGSVSGDAPGVDVDAVCLLNLGGMVTNTAGLYQSEELLGTSEETILVNFTDAFEDPAEESDCRTNAVTIAADPLPNPPVELPPAPPVYVAPPVFQLPKTGPVAAGAPVLGGTGILSAMWWMVKRKRG